FTLASEIQQLPVLQGYLSVAGYDVAAVSFAAIAGEGKQPGFIARIPNLDTNQTPPCSVAAVPAVSPPFLVMQPLPARVEEENEAEEMASASVLTAEDVSPAHQLDLFPVEQKRKI